MLEEFGLSTSVNIIHVSLYACLFLFLISLVTSFLINVLSHNSLLNFLSSQDGQLKICHFRVQCLLSEASKHISNIVSAHTH